MRVTQYVRSCRHGIPDGLFTVNVDWSKCLLFITVTLVIIVYFVAFRSLLIATFMRL